MRKETNIIFKSCLTMLLVLVMLRINAQDAQVISTHTNKAWYINGDLMQYKLTLPEVPAHVIAVKVDLISNSEIIVHQSYHKSSGQSIEGFIELPIDITSGMYYLIFSGTDINTKEQISLAEIHVPIYSDVEELSIPNTDVNSELEPNIAGSLNVNATVLNNSISKRDSIHLKIEVKEFDSNSAGHLSVSVNPIEDTLLSNSLLHFHQLNKEVSVSELDSSIYLKGTIKTANNKEKKYPVIGLYDADNYTFDYLQTDERGSFSHPLDEFTGAKQLQFVNYNNEDIKVSIENISISKSAPPLVFNEKVAQCLNESRKRKKINHFFNISHTDNLSLTLEEDSLTQPKGDRTIVTSQFEAFEDLVSMFSEIVTARLRFRKNKEDKLYAQVFNKSDVSRGYYPGDPVFIVDGLVTKNAEYVNNLDMNLIDQIDIISNYERLYQNIGPLGHAGVVFIQTSIPNLQLDEKDHEDIFTIHGFQNAANIRNTNSPDSHTPIFKSTIHWEPQISLSSDGTTLLTYPHSDDVGLFNIDILVNSSKNKFGHKRIQYSVNK